MVKTYQEIKKRIVEGVNIEKIYLLDLGCILLLTIVWDSRKNDFDKRIHIRKLLRDISVPFDVIVVSTDEFNSLHDERSSFTYDVIKKGILLYD